MISSAISQYKIDNISDEQFVIYVIHQKKNAKNELDLKG